MIKDLDSLMEELENIRREKGNIGLMVTGLYGSDADINEICIGEDYRENEVVVFVTDLCTD